MQTSTPTITSTAQATSFELIASAVQSGKIDIETIKELRALQKEMKADAAREAFVQAMASFQAECPVVEKTKPVKSKTGQIVYFYAPIDSIVQQVGPTIARNGLAYTFDIQSDEKELTATCKVTHTQGHFETFTFRVPIGSEQYMTEVQKFGARATFAKRNAFCNAFGIATGDEDTDATQTDTDKKPIDKRAQIAFALRTLDFPTAGKDADEVRAKVLSLTQLELSETNADEILERLNMIITERNADQSAE